MRKVIPRKPKQPKRFATPEKYIAYMYHRGRSQQLEGQTSQPHYNTTKDRIVSCSVCEVENTKLQRHRIIPGTEYTERNVLIVCIPCHQLIHRLLDELGGSGKDYLFNCKFAIELAKQEVRNRE